MDKKTHSIKLCSRKLLRSKKETLKLWSLLKKSWFNSVVVNTTKGDKKKSHIQKKVLWFMLKTKYTNIQLLYKIKKKIGYGRIIVVSTIKKK